jgi:hypothetical protein
MAFQKKNGTKRHVDSDPETATLDGVNERNLLRKLDLRLLPAVSLLYLLSFLDRSNGG